MLQDMQVTFGGVSQLIYLVPALCEHCAVVRLERRVNLELSCLCSKQDAKHEQDELLQHG